MTPNLCVVPSVISTQVTSSQNKIMPLFFSMSWELHSVTNSESNWLSNHEKWVETRIIIGMSCWIYNKVFLQLQLLATKYNIIMTCIRRNFDPAAWPGSKALCKSRNSDIDQEIFWGAWHWILFGRKSIYKVRIRDAAAQTRSYNCV
jgi:hypothetical protein